MNTLRRNIGEISVVISTYDDPIDFVKQCIGSLFQQEKISEIIVVDSSKKDEIKRFCLSFGDRPFGDGSFGEGIDMKKDECEKRKKITYLYTPPKGMSDARNKGVDIAKTDIVAFTDADCIIDNNWAYNISISFNKWENIAIVGGKVIPRWIARPNKILYNSAIAQGFYSSFDMGEELKEVDQIFGGNFAVNKKLIKERFGYLFLTELGRGKGNLLGGEETQLCRQVRNSGLRIVYNPLAVVLHQIPEERSKLKWMWKRIYYGGINRVTVGGMPTPKTVNIPYNLYDAIFLAIFIVPYMYGILRAQFTKMKLKM